MEITTQDKPAHRVSVADQAHHRRSLGESAANLLRRSRAARCRLTAADRFGPSSHPRWPLENIPSRSPTRQPCNARRTEERRFRTVIRSGAESGPKASLFSSRKNHSRRLPVKHFVNRKLFEPWLQRCRYLPKLIQKNRCAEHNAHERFPSSAQFS